MTLGRGGLSLLVLSAIALSACQSEDKAPLPPYVSTYSEYGAPKASIATPYYIEFRSRYALSYGHTYVIFGQLNKAGGVATREVAGLSPASTDEAPYIVGHVIPVPAETGETDGDLEEQYRSASWRVKLTAEQYRDVVAFIRQLKAKSHTWQATVNNCNAWVGEIARHMGYKVPPIWLRPQQFITKLREMNA